MSGFEAIALYSLGALVGGAGHAWLHPTCMPEMNQARLALAGREVRRLLGFSEADE
jgi:hypothetical protein